MDEEAAKAIEEVMNMLGNDPPVMPLDSIPAVHAEKEPGEEPEAVEAEEEQLPPVPDPENNPVPGRKRNGFILAALAAAVISLTLVAMLVLAPCCSPPLPSRFFLRATRLPPRPAYR